jgi:hypothetical protein
VNRRRVGTGALVAIALIVAACSGGDGDSDDSSSTESAAVTSSTRPLSTGSSTSTTSPRSTTTTSDDDEGTETTERGGTTTTLVPTTTTIPDGPKCPLTGLPVIDDDPKCFRAALVVKIDNHPQARPQTGLNNADIVYEENVELLTRFAAVFQSEDSDPVGPVRSGRTQDVDLVASLNNPLFAWSGGNATVTRVIRNSPDLIDVSWTVAGERGGYRRVRSPGIDLEHTLYASTPLLFQNFTPPFAPPPLQQFTYRAEGEAFNGEANLGAELAMDGITVRWLWDADETRYEREQAGEPHMVVGGEQVNAANVVILEVQYGRSAADPRSPEAQTIGFGPAFVLTAGVMIQGTWERPDKLSPFVLKDLDGNVVALTPGRTWVELARRDKTTPLT